MNYTALKYFPDKPTLIYGNGDGTVNDRSLRGCLRWNADANAPPLSSNSYKPRISAKKKKKWLLQQKAAGYSSNSNNKVYHQEFSGVDHMAILTNPDVLTYIKNAVQSMNIESTNAV